MHNSVSEEYETDYITDEEWSERVHNDCYEDWYLIHLDGGLFQNSSPIPRYAKLSGSATLQDVLTAIEDMTISRGQHEICDHVRFEGIRHVMDNVWAVLTGS